MSTIDRNVNTKCGARPDASVSGPSTGGGARSAAEMALVSGAHTGLETFGRFQDAARAARPAEEPPVAAGETPPPAPAAPATPQAPAPVAESPVPASPRPGVPAAPPAPAGRRPGEAPPLLAPEQMAEADAAAKSKSDRIAKNLVGSTETSAWGDLSKSVPIVGDGTPRFVFKKGSSYSSVREELYLIAQRNVAAQPNHITLPGGIPGMRIDGVDYSLPKDGLFHSFGGRADKNSPAVAQIGDVMNASVIVPGIAGDNTFRIAPVDFGEQGFAVLVFDKANKLTDFRLHSINVRTGTAARRVSAPAGSRPTAVTLSQVMRSWQEDFLPELSRRASEKMLAALRDSFPMDAKARKAFHAENRGVAVGANLGGRIVFLGEDARRVGKALGLEVMGKANSKTDNAVLHFPAEDLIGNLQQLVTAGQRVALFNDGADMADKAQQQGLEARRAKAGRDAVAEEGLRRGLAGRPEVEAELRDLVAWYNTSDGCPEYYARNAAELFAESFGAAVNYPEIARVKAPRFMKLMDGWIEANPEAARALAEARRRAGALEAKAIRTGRSQPDEAFFGELRSVTAAQTEARRRIGEILRSAGRQTVEEANDFMRAWFIGRFEPVWKRIRRHGGWTREESAKAWGSLNRLSHWANGGDIMAYRWRSEVAPLVAKVKGGQDAFDEFLVNWRVANEALGEGRTGGRVNLANPLGLTPGDFTGPGAEAGRTAAARLKSIAERDPEQWYVQRYIGTPDPTDRPRVAEYPLFNLFVPFWTMNVHGNHDQLVRLAGEPGQAGVQAARYVAHTSLKWTANFSGPALMAYAEKRRAEGDAEAAALAEEVAAMQRAIPAFDRLSGICVPLAWADRASGKVWYLRIPSGQSVSVIDGLFLGSSARSRRQGWRGRLARALRKRGRSVADPQGRRQTRGRACDGPALLSA